MAQLEEAARYATQTLASQPGLRLAAKVLADALLRASGVPFAEPEGDALSLDAILRLVPADRVEDLPKAECILRGAPPSIAPALRATIFQIQLAGAAQKYYQAASEALSDGDGDPETRARAAAAALRDVASAWLARRALLARLATSLPAGSRPRLEAEAAGCLAEASAACRRSLEQCPTSAASWALYACTAASEVGAKE